MSDTPPRILLVEDDTSLGSATEQGLRKVGYAVDWVQDGAAAEDALKTADYAAIVLDIGLPARSGLDILRDLRNARNSVPVVIISAREPLRDRIAGLDAGADDYLVKPFELSELMARLRAVVRRGTGRPISMLSCGDLTVDTGSKTVSRHGEAITLSLREYQILLQLLQHQGHALSRDRLEANLYGLNEELGSNAIEVHVHHLRKKLGEDLIHTVRGVGYLIAKDAA